MPSHRSVPAHEAALAALLFFLVPFPLAAQQAPLQTENFRHSTHRQVDCQACHRSDDRHPALDSQTCLTCHHRSPATSDCRSCHAADDARAIDGRVVRTLDIQVGSLDRPERILPVSHEAHAGIRCQTCHTSGPALSAAKKDCTSCHEQHHQPSARCTDCHAAPAPGAHDMNVHQGCGGSGCHENVPASIQSVPRTRTFCLVCHQDMARHKPDEPCASCHMMPPPGTAGR
jgi:hypothetical protein